MLGCHVTKADNHIHQCGLEHMAAVLRNKGLLPPLLQEVLDQRKQLIREDGRLKSLRATNKKRKFGSSRRRTQGHSQKAIG